MKMFIIVYVRLGIFFSVEPHMRVPPSHIKHKIVWQTK